VTSFCQKAYEESRTFITPDPKDICKYHLHYEVVRSFPEWSCLQQRKRLEDGSFEAASRPSFSQLLRLQTTTGQVVLRAEGSRPCRMSSPGRCLHSASRRPVFPCLYGLSIDLAFFVWSYRAYYLNSPKVASAGYWRCEDSFGTSFAKEIIYGEGMCEVMT
jgi:hypothetical protein